MELLTIDLKKILRRRMGLKGKLIPGFLISGLEKFIHQKELNEILTVTYPAQGSEFSRKVFEYLDLQIEVEGEENIPEHGRFIFASNHPLGGLDGIAIIKVLGERYGDANIGFPVNDMLMNVEPLRNVFLAINKYGSQGREAARKLNEAFASDKQIAMFPAGLVSRMADDGTVADLQWQKSFIAKAIEYKRDIIPMRFVALNRPRFYKLARWRRHRGIKVNFEQAMLPAELCASRGRRFRLIFGKPISYQELAESSRSYPELAADIRSRVYALHAPERL